MAEQAPDAGAGTVSQPSTHPLAATFASAPALPEQFGRYRIVKQLGKGGMGAVYLAHDTQLNRQVALKVPHFGAADGPQVLERFYREARAAATFDHPNLCPVHDVGQIGGVHYLTMPYIDGKPLSDLLTGGKPLPPRQVAAVVRKVALALEEAHQRGVIHRDLKPSNIMLNRRGEPVVMDFGLARQAAAEDVRLTGSGMIVGTPAYMSPEQVTGEGQAVGPASDIYSLGVILYELLTGQLPFQGPVASVLGQILVSEPPKPSSLRPDLDARIEAVCLQAMAKKPDERYRSMKEFAAALAEYLRTDVRPATPPHAQRSAEKAFAGPRRLRRWIWIAAGAVGVGLFGWLLAGVLFHSEPEQDKKLADLDQPPAKQSTESDRRSPVAAAPAEIDLLAQIDSATAVRLAARPNVSWDGKRLEIRADSGTTQVPIRLAPEGAAVPEQYDLTTRVVRQRRPDKDPGLGLGIVFPLPGARRGEVYLDGYYGSGLSGIDGKDYQHPATHFQRKLFRVGVPSVVVCSVRKQGITVAVDGTPWIQWKGNLNRFPQMPSEHPKLPGVNPRHFVVVWAHESRYLVTELRLRPVGP